MARGAGSSSTRLGCVACALLSGWLALGCGLLLGTDEYEIGEPPVDNPCGALEVPLGDGRCEEVGVNHPCPNGFADDEAGGCAPIMPQALCGRGLVTLPGDAPISGERWLTAEPFGGTTPEPRPLGVLRLRSNRRIAVRSG